MDVILNVKGDEMVIITLIMLFVFLYEAVDTIANPYFEDEYDSNDEYKSDDGYSYEFDHKEH